MNVYVPAFETQRDEGAPTPWTNCTPASAAMLVDHYTYGQRRTSDVALRRASSVPLDRGLNFAQVAEAIRRVLPDLGTLRYSEADGSGNANWTWAHLRDHLAAGGAAVVAGTYSSLAGQRALSGLALDRWQPGGAFGHAAFVCDYRPESAGGDGAVLWMDPLGHGNYAGDRMPLGALYRFLWRRGNNDAADRVTAAHGFTSPRPSPRTFSDVDPATNAHAADIEAAARLGLMGGIGRGLFGSGQALTRDQAASIAVRIRRSVIEELKQAVLDELRKEDPAP